MQQRQHKDVLIGYPRHARDVRICTPLGEVWVAFRDAMGDDGTPGMIVSIDGGDDRRRPCPVSVQHKEDAHVHLWVNSPAEEPETR